MLPSMQDAERLIDNLKSTDLDERSTAINSLVSFDASEILEFLISLLSSDTHRLVKDGVCKTLGKIGDKSVQQKFLLVHCRMKMRL